MKAVALEEAGDMAFLTDWQGFFVYVNKTAREALGYTAQEMAGMHATLVDRNMAKTQRVAAALKRHGRCVFTSIHTRKDGREIPVEVNSKVITYNGRQFILNLARDITRRIRAQEKLKIRHRHLIATNNQLRLKSQKDPLTDIYNRLFFDRTMARMEGNREYYPIAIFVLDVDGLKLVNDILGHSKGDLFLQKAVSLIKAHFRTEDIIARLGGDEFAVLMPRSGHQIAAEKAGLLRRAAWDNLRGYLPVCFSVGFAVTQNIFKSLYDVCREADAAMYRDKAAHCEETLIRLKQSLHRLRNEGYHDF